MIYTATVTSQGQITIPVQLRRELDLDRAVISIKKNNHGSLEIEKTPDLLSLGGSLNKYVKDKYKDLSAKEMKKLERKAIDEARAEEYERTLKRMSDKPIIV